MNDRGHDDTAKYSPTRFLLSGDRAFVAHGLRSVRVKADNHLVCGHRVFAFVGWCANEEEQCFFERCRPLFGHDLVLSRGRKNRYRATAKAGSPVVERTDRGTPPEARSGLQIGHLPNKASNTIAVLDRSDTILNGRRFRS